MAHPVSHRLDAVRTDLENRGFSLEADGEATVATGGSLGDVDAPLHVVYPRDGTPLTIASTLATAAQQGRVPVLITDEWLLDDVREVLATPLLLAADCDGVREFYNVDDRIHLSDGGFACLGTPGRSTWSETTPNADDPSLCLEAGDETVAVLDSVDSLRCPGPSTAAFEYRYERSEAGQLCVFRGDELVGQYPSFRSMRTDGFRPVSLPLVPEHHVRQNGHLARATRLAVPDDETVSYRAIPDL